MIFETGGIFVFGLIVGSFLNALVWRCAHGRSIRTGRSQCTACGHKLSAIDLIPVVSFVFLSGKCRYCSVRIASRYPLVELSVALLFSIVYAALYWPAGLAFSSLASGAIPFETVFRFVRDLFFVAVLVAIFVVDLYWFIIPDIITLPAAGAAFVINAFLLPSYPWTNLVFAAMIGAGFFALQYILSRGKWIGGGDIRFGALMGCMLGFPGVLGALFIAYILGALVSSVLLIRSSHGFKSALPFGPFLVCGTFAMFFFEGPILSFFQQMYVI